MRNHHQLLQSLWPSEYRAALDGGADGPDLVVSVLVLAVQAIHRRQSEMADQIAQLTQDVALLQTTITAYQVAVKQYEDNQNSTIAALQATVTDLKAHPAAPDLSSQIASLEAVIAQVGPAPIQPPATPATTADSTVGTAGNDPVGSTGT
jgi:hypothetical protein